MTRKEVTVIVIKIGTNVLSNDDGTLDIQTIANIVSQIVHLKKLKEYRIVVVSSGAVGAGKSTYPNLPIRDETISKQVLSSIGQVKLMNLYSSLFEIEGFICAQVLATKEDFRDDEHFLNMSNCLIALLQERIIPIINENDVVAVRELMFTDNDELAGLIASMINAQYLFLLTSVDGIFDGDPSDSNSRVIPQVNPESEDFIKYALQKKSTFGRGGMKTKLKIAKLAALQGRQVYIINGKSRNVIIDALEGKVTGTLVSTKPKQRI